MCTNASFTSTKRLFAHIWIASGIGLALNAVANRASERRRSELASSSANGALSHHGIQGGEPCRVPAG